MKRQPNEIGEIPLSNNTVKIRIDEMSGIVEEHLISALRHSGIYSLHLEKSTDIADNKHLTINAFLKWQ